MQTVNFSKQEIIELLPFFVRVLLVKLGEDFR